MNSLLTLPDALLLDLAEGLEGGTISVPVSTFALRNMVAEAERQGVCTAINQMFGASGTSQLVAHSLRLAVEARRQGRSEGPAIDLVWTGPEGPQARTRDTMVVVAELFHRAKRRVLVSTYNLHEAASIFAPLASQMDRSPSLQVRLITNLGTRWSEAKSRNAEAEWRTAFKEKFPREHWSGGRMPEVYYDPRPFSSKSEWGMVHAKCIVIDGEEAFVTSANISETAQSRNLEAGVLVRSAPFATALESQFERLIRDGALVRVLLNCDLAP